MAKLCLMASVNFFIPLRGVHLGRKGVLEAEFNDLVPPIWVNRSVAKCEWAKFKEDGKQVFYYKYTPYGSSKEVTRNTAVTARIVRYKTSTHEREYLYYLMLTAELDKYYQSEYPVRSVDERLYSIDDVIQLEKNIYEDTLFYPQKDSTVSFNKWFNQLANDAEKGPNKTNRTLPYALVNLHAVNIPDPNPFSAPRTENDITNAFNQAYYCGTVPSVIDVLGKDHMKLAYGLLFANDNYRRLPQEELERVVGTNYSNNKCETYYAAPSSILWIHVHSSFDASAPRQKKLYFGDTLFEMCEVMAAKRKLAQIRRLLTVSTAQGIKHALASLATYMETNTFNLPELDYRLNCMFEAMDIEEEFKSVKTIGELEADSYNIEQNHKQNVMIGVLTAITVLLGVMNLLPFMMNVNSNNKDMILNNCTNTGFTLNIGVVIIFLLLLIFVCLCVICYHTWQQRMEIRKTLRQLEELL